MKNEPSLCAVCAWRKDCQKRFLKGPEVQLRCPDFSKDLAIKDTEKLDAEKKDSGHN
jgi:hypothetical protein